MFSYIFQHPDYDDIFIDNDIALLYLSERALTSQSNIRKMSRLSNDSIDAQILADSSISCGITGWGYEIDDRGIIYLLIYLSVLHFYEGNIEPRLNI